MKSRTRCVNTLCCRLHNDHRNIQLYVLLTSVAMETYSIDFDPDWYGNGKGGEAEALRLKVDTPYFLFMKHVSSSKNLKLTPSIPIR